MYDEQTIENALRTKKISILYTMLCFIMLQFMFNSKLNNINQTDLRYLTA